MGWRICRDACADGHSLLSRVARGRVVWRGETAARGSHARRQSPDIDLRARPRRTARRAADRELRQQPACVQREHPDAESVGRDGVVRGRDGARWPRVEGVGRSVMNRRTFLQTSGGVAAGMAIGLPSSMPNVITHVPLRRVGLELYSVRKEMAQDFDRTLAAVRAIGYTDVELLWSFNNWGKSTAQVKAALEREGLRAPSAHISPTAMLVNWERRLETAKTLGHDYLIVPSLTSDTSQTLDDWRAWADRFNEAGAVARRAGVWLAFHNEPDHMKPIEGQVPYDVFVARTDPRYVRHQLDVGNMALGG